MSKFLVHPSHSALGRKISFEVQPEEPCYWQAAVAEGLLDDKAILKCQMPREIMGELKLSIWFTEPLTTDGKITVIEPNHYWEQSQPSCIAQSRVPVAIEETAVSAIGRVKNGGMEACGINHSAASFQFVDVAMADLGRWMQPLIGQG